MTVAKMMVGLEEEIRGRAAAGLVKWAERFLGMPYWYGTYCNECSRELFEGKRRQYPGHYDRAREGRYRADIEAGKVCADCVGLIKGYAWYDTVTGRVRYGRNGCPDESANGMYEYCVSKGMPHGAMYSMPDVPGIMLHRSGHVGVYIGGGKAIEARGFAYGCVKTTVSGRGWQHWTYLPFIAYGEAACAKPVEYKLGERVLCDGSTGRDVKEMQGALLQLGYDIGDAGVDGDFGPDTLAALVTFQSDSNIDADGVFGPVTLAVLNEALALQKTLDKVPGDGKSDSTPGTNPDKTTDTTPDATTGTTPDATPATTLAVDATELNVRSGPGTNYSVVGKVRSGDRLIPVDTSGWQLIDFDGEARWVSARYVG